MFESLQASPADAILGLITEHRDDPRAEKIDLGVGVYRNADGETPILDVVKEAEQRLVESQDSKSYISTAGNASFNAAIQSLAFANSVPEDRLMTIQTPGGSGSLRVAAGLILRATEKATIWVSEPTWNNHVPLLGGAGMTLKPYPYYDVVNHVIQFEAMLDSLHKVPKGDLVLFHACCHNPTGLDPSEEQWREITDIVVERELVPFIDMAYQGFAVDLDTDAFAVRHMASAVPEMIVSTSGSKNFGLYRERIGALSFLLTDINSRDILASQAGSYVRTLYSMPPDHGAAVVGLILLDAELRARWTVELYTMRDRLRDMRSLLHDALKVKASGHDFSHLVRATGMFCFLGISKEQVERLKKDFGVYMVDSSRINVAGIAPGNIEYLADSIAAVLS
ncbi:MAG: aspartate/tyrosine/aromatic aminotransferase [Proteobacteria bacterium]|nr:aspartate/tyrosine/aromatic aminotransferase [Pseudomonadota bacterium]